MNIKILFKLEQDEDGYPPVSYESLWAKEKDGSYQIDNIPFYIYDISLGDIVSVEVKNKEFWFKKIIESSTNSTIRLYCPNETLWEDIKIKLEELNCRWETTNNLKAINIPKLSIQTILSYFDKIKETDSDFDYEDSSLR